ncbi:MAG: cation:proton antiporter [Limisphaerales bacterium]
MTGGNPGQLLILFGCFFFFAGTVGLLRFPDAFTRLHALTKADNLGLGFVVIGLAFESASLAVGLKLVMIWVLALLASSSACHFIGRNLLINPTTERRRTE